MTSNAMNVFANDVFQSEEEILAVANVMRAMSSYERDLEYAEELQLREVMEASKPINSRRKGAVHQSSADLFLENISKAYSLQATQLFRLAGNKKFTETFNKIEKQEQTGHRKGRNFKESKDKSFVSNKLPAKRKFGETITSQDTSDATENTQPAKIRRQSPARHSCQTCFDDFCTFDLSSDINKMASSSATLGVILHCTHGFCLSCMKNYLNVLLQEESISFPIKCPLKCETAEISENIAEKVLTSEGMGNWYLKMALSTIKNKIYCPNKRCSAIFDYDPEGSSQGSPVECPICLKEFCPLCCTSWHFDLTCEQYQALPPSERAPEDRAVLKLAQNEKWKRCPKCRVLVQLDTGCNHITCRCKTEFCYKCGELWDKKQERCVKKCDLWDELMLLEERARRQRIQELNQERLLRARVVVIPRAQQVREMNMDVIIFLDLIYWCIFQTAGRGNANQNGRVRVRANHAVQQNNRINRPDIDLRTLFQKYKNKEVNVNRWLKTMLDSNRCGYCYSRFDSLLNLENHLKHTPNHEVYYCCGKLFELRANIRQHRTSVHPGAAQ
ncbi:16180_t:CDS:10 [Acaulospora morrowiae]|uniref:RBR-type E3 ubiquitin transferase n=1 Tax=Acaulospora morrowiae TaxID=94023 RepID=A0A9N9HZQ2_9GLOM|nr:16180_t:CDS:10 [Acaulospora morrowiae]